MSMDKFFGVAMDRRGNVITGATVTVTQYFSGNPATLYADNESTLLGTITTDANGRFEFCGPNGVYNVSVTKNGVTTEQRHVVLSSGSEVNNYLGILVLESVVMVQTAVPVQSNTTINDYVIAHEHEHAIVP